MLSMVVFRHKPRQTFLIFSVFMTRVEQEKKMKKKMQEYDHDGDHEMKWVIVIGFISVTC